MNKSYNIQLHIEVKNEKEIKELCHEIEQRKGKLTVEDLVNLPIEWDIKTDVVELSNDYSKIEEIKWNEDILNGDNKVIASLPE